MSSRLPLAAGVLGAAVLLFPVVLFAQVDVPSNWSLSPSRLGEGDEFRLLLVTAAPYAATETALSHYDGLIQALVADRGHPDIRAYASEFKVLGSSSTKDARAHTETTGADGVPIYWLNGAKLANDYGDFYDGTWRNKSPGNYQTGALILGESQNQSICTGSLDDGRKTTNPLGGYGFGQGFCTATSISTDTTTLSGFLRDIEDPPRYFGLSSVFRVGAFAAPAVVNRGVTISSTPGDDGEYVAGDEITVAVTFSEAVTVTGKPRIEMILRDDVKGKATYVATGSTPTVLVFSYTVGADDLSTGIKFAETKLTLNGGTIKAGAVDAVLEYAEVATLSEHKIHVKPRLESLSVTSTPGNGQSYVTGEILQVTATFDKPVRVAGDPKIRIDLDTGRVVIGPANVDENNVHFEYTIGPADYNQEFLGSPDDAIRMSGENVIVHPELSDKTAFALPNRTLAKVADFSLNGVEAPVNTHRPIIVGDEVKLTSTPVTAAGTYGLGEAIEVTVTFSAPVFVDTTFGTPYVAVALETADSATYSKVAQALYESGSGTSTLVFHYTVEAADEDDDGFHIDADSLFPNSGTIRDRVATDSAATDADLGHLAPGENNGDFPDHKVDGSLSSSTNRAPTFSAASTTRSFTETVGDAAVQIAADIGAAVTAMDDDNDALAYSLGGTDAAEFTIDDSSGQIQTRVNEKYDHEAKASYTVTVTADDKNGGTDTITVTISVGDQTEAPLAPGMPTVSSTSGSRTSLEVNWTAPNNAGRPPIEGYDLRYKKTSDGGWTAGPEDQTGVRAEIAGLEQGTSYEVQVQATNGDGDGAWSGTGSGTTNANNAPEFSDASITRTFTEAIGDEPVSIAADIGAAVTADDADDDTLTYSLGGTDAAEFTIVLGSGQIRTKVGEQYDRETKASYTVTVTADDKNGGTDTITVTISVGNATEVPLAPGTPSVSATSGDRTRLDVTWTAPDNVGRPGITGYKLQYKKTDGGWTGPQDHDGLSATIIDLDQDTSYEVQVQAINDDGVGAWSDTGSGTTNANNAPEFATASITRTFTETIGDAAVQTAADIGAAVTADDADDDTLTYSLGGTDAAEFTIVLGSGQIRTKVGEQYDRETKASYTVTVTAEDVHDGTDTITVTIDVDNATEPPLPPGMPTVSATSGERTSLDVTWAAPDNVGRPGITGYKLQYKKTDGGWTGPQDHDGLSATIIDLDQDTSYEVQVQATNDDGDGEWSGTGSGSTNANNAPAFLASSTTRSFTETVGDAAVQTAADIGAAVTAMDDDNDTLTYSLVEGADKAKFDIVSTSGQIRTKVGAQYDHEAKASYSVTVKADDVHGGADTIGLTISIGDQAEAPLTPAVPSVSSTADTTTSLDVNWSEPNNAGRPAITGYDLRYRQGTSSGWTDGPPDLTTTNATIGSLEEDTPYKVQVRATNNDGDGAWSNEGDGRTNAPANNAPAFADNGVTLDFDETVGAETVQVAADIGSPITATDEDEDDTLNHSLEGADEAKFTIEPSSGQIRTKVGEAYDRETTASYSVIVKADDNNGGTDTIDVTINVNNEPEPPLPPAAPTVSATSGNRNSLDVNWIAPNNVGRPAITSYDLQYMTSDNGWTAGPQNQTGVSAEIAGLEQGTSYEVQVQATNGDGDGAWSDTGSGTTNANNAPTFSAGTTTRSFTETVGDAAVSTAADIGAAVTAMDDDNDTLTYSLEGADAARFAIDDSSGQIQTRVNEKYDREAKASYTVTVKADDKNGGTDTIDVTISVGNETEVPLTPGMPTVSATSGSRTSLDVSWSAPNNAGRPPIEGYDLRYKKPSASGWTAGPEDQTGVRAEIAGLEQDTSYEIQVLATNDDGDSDWSSTGGGRTNANSAPAFSGSTTRSFTETVGDAAVQTAADIGAEVTADDDDNDTLTYSLGGTDAAEFTIVLGSGQIRTNVGKMYDYEAKASYTVTVTADDNNGGTDTIDVTINVDDATELPLPPAAPTVSATSGERTSLDVTWAAPDNVGRPGITGYKLQYKKTDGGWTGPQDHDGLSATIIDLDQDTSYDVQVLAANVDGDGEWSDTGSGTTNANNAPAFATASATRSFRETVGDAAVQTAADIGAAVTADDDDNDTLTYSLGGTDAAEFTIVLGSG